MYILFVIVHILVGLLLILSVLLQSGKAGDLASAFGGAASQTAFGARGATTFLSKATTSAAILFMVTSLGLSILSDSGSTSVLDQVDVPASAPATPPPGTDSPPTDGAQPPDGGSDQTPAATEPPPETPPPDGSNQ